MDFSLSKERYLFRLATQEIDESMEMYHNRLIKLAKNCKFQDCNDQIKDQIIEKTWNKELRQRAFQQEMTLHELVCLGKSLDKIKSTIKVEPKLENEQKNKDEEKPKIFCSACGNNNHASYDKSCPAILEWCRNCGKKGHFQAMCWTMRKRKYENLSRKNFHSEYRRNVIKRSSSSEKFYEMNKPKLDKIRDQSSEKENKNNKAKDENEIKNDDSLRSSPMEYEFNHSEESNDAYDKYIKLCKP
jgi:hypothetical protein